MNFPNGVFSIFLLLLVAAKSHDAFYEAYDTARTLLQQGKTSVADLIMAFAHTAALDTRRAEPLYYLARLYRTHGNFHLASIIGHHLIHSLPHPPPNCEKPEPILYGSGWASQDEYATALWFSGFRQEALQVWRYILDHHSHILPAHAKERLENNVKTL
jgi:hypothetical protein